MHDGEQVCKGSEPDVNGIKTYLKWYANINVNSKVKNWHNYIKMLDIVISSCVQVRDMMVHKCETFQSYKPMSQWSLKTFVVVRKL
jgi:hypothetical protein